MVSYPRTQRPRLVLRSAHVIGTRARFALGELMLWASIYPAYLAIRGLTIGDPDQALTHATRLIDLERSLDLFHETALQQLVGAAVGFFSIYYMVGFAPLLVTVLGWLAIRHRAHYRDLRSLLFVSLGIAVFFYVLYPTAPPRLVPGLGIADTVGMAGHDTGSFAGIRINPYAAMPSMHVGWSVLLAIVGYRATSSRLLRSFFVAHPLLMAITVTATGNHYFVDSIAGATAALAAVTLVALYRRSRTSASGVRQARIEPAAA
jgi:PAP2 superfamily